MTVNKRFFDDLMRDRSLSLRSVARQLEMLPSQLSLTFNGKRRMQMAEAVRLGQVLGAPVNDVMIAAGIEEAKTTRRRCSVVRYIGGEGFPLPIKSGEADRVLLPDVLPDHCVAIQARTADSPYSFTDGWLFYCDPEKKSPNELLGHFSWVKIEGGGERMGTLRRGYERGTFNITAGVTNEQNQRLEWACKIIMATF